GGGAGRRQLREDVGQVRERRDPVLRAGAHQAVERGGASGRVMRPAEEIIPSAQRDVPQLGLTHIVIGIEAAVLEKPREGRPVIHEIPRRLGEVGARRFLRARESTPSMQFLHDRRRPIASPSVTVVGRQYAQIDPISTWSGLRGSSTLRPVASVRTMYAARTRTANRSTRGSTSVPTPATQSASVDTGMSAPLRA